MPLLRLPSNQRTLSIGARYDLGSGSDLQPDFLRDEFLPPAEKRELFDLLPAERRGRCKTSTLAQRIRPITSATSKAVS
jgi:hypothetical protein